MIAGLPMYDRPETFGANDRLWSLTKDALADRRVPAPDRLTRGIDPWTLWHRPDLVLAQTCGLPYRTGLHGKVELVATPVQDLPCEPGFYFSEIVTRMDDPRSTPAEFDNARLAVNEQCSQSGWAAPRQWAAVNGISFGEILLTGSHSASSHAVAEGQSDLAAIDALTWKMIERWDAHAAGLRVVARTEPTPTLPYISARGSDSDLISRALDDAISELSEGDRAILGLNGITRISWERYFPDSYA